jgi:hypothetical protein
MTPNFRGKRILVTLAPAMDGVSEGAVSRRDLRRRTERIPAVSQGIKPRFLWRRFPRRR